MAATTREDGGPGSCVAESPCGHHPQCRADPPGVVLFLHGYIFSGVISEGHWRRRKKFPDSIVATTATTTLLAAEQFLGFYPSFIFCFFPVAISYQSATGSYANENRMNLIKKRTYNFCTRSFWSCDVSPGMTSLAELRSNWWSLLKHVSTLVACFRVSSD